MQCVIFCGGFASRLYPVTHKIPKSMLTVNGKPFLEIQLKMLKKNGVGQVILLTGFLQEQIESYFGDGKKFGVRLEYVKGSQNFGTGFALKRAAPFVEDEFLTLWGDSYLEMNYKKFFTEFVERPCLGMMSVYENHDRIDKSNIEIGNGLVKTYDMNARQNQIRYAYIDYGCHAFRKKTLDMIPNDHAYKHGQLFQALIAQKQMAAYVVKQRPYEIGSFSGLEELQKKLADEKKIKAPSDERHF
ncbi:MAG TPA: sugar phosphate nucleotidyltransferase [archaeon]|nr:sugar phosphate nucleotidyltransferase [archaeon]